MANPLTDIIQAAQTKLAATSFNFTEIGCYEGQLDDTDNITVNAPCAFIEIPIGNSETEDYLAIDLNLNIYLCGLDMIDNDPVDSMCEMLWEIIGDFHGTYLDDYAVFYKSFERFVVLSGFYAYVVTFNLKYEPGA